MLRIPAQQFALAIRSRKDGVRPIQPQPTVQEIAFKRLLHLLEVVLRRKLPRHHPPAGVLGIRQVRADECRRIRPLVIADVPIAAHILVRTREFSRCIGRNWRKHGQGVQQLCLIPNGKRHDILRVGRARQGGCPRQSGRTAVKVRKRQDAQVLVHPTSPHSPRDPEVHHIVAIFKPLGASCGIHKVGRLGTRHFHHRRFDKKRHRQQKPNHRQSAPVASEENVEIGVVSR